MHKISVRQREISAATRGQIIQRVLVDGWSPSHAAQFLGIDERRVKRWVRQFRRQGMASLRGDLAAEKLPRRWVAWLRSRAARLVAGLRSEARKPQPASCVVLRRTGEESIRL
ncbi:MAG: helix-turn-helix domain-containing protein [Alphaproteobacteria bacterium]|nr:helix-turn-helix domain-containing protein [Alphaproteobacteria bacterium]